MYFVFQIPRKEVESHLQTTMTLHLDLTSKIFKETTSKLEEKVNKLQLKQVELDQERTTLKMQVRELTTTNASLNAKIIAQGKHVTELKGECSKYVWKMTGFSAILKDAKDGVKKEIYTRKSIRNWKTGLQIIDLCTTRWRPDKEEQVPFGIPGCDERKFRRHIALAFSQ